MKHVVNTFVWKTVENALWKTVLKHIVMFIVVVFRLPQENKFFTDFSTDCSTVVPQSFPQTFPQTFPRHLSTFPAAFFFELSTQLTSRARGHEPPGAAWSSQGPPRAAKGRWEQPRAAGSSRGPPEPAKGGLEQPGAPRTARSSWRPPGARRGCEEPPGASKGNP